ncbi:MAG: valine--tRNA ligase [Actinomycetota bacterium]
MPLSDLQQRTRWDPAEAEPRIVERWLHSGLFHPEPAGDAGENYSLAIPPPNVTGSLHMGHGLVLAIEDVLIRYHRMLGKRTKWIFGTDHAGIATQRVVEKQLEAEGTTREAIGREAFIERVWEWRRQYGSRIVEQTQRMGASCDYEDERFTLDDDYVAAVMKVFVALYEKGLIYRDRYLVNWDPGLRSAISDLEVEEREVTDTLYSIAYPLEEGGEIVVSTVRPETMLADTAVAVHPDDERYRHLIGSFAELPLVGRRLEIIADAYVKPEFGTGALKITPGHDPNDFEIGRAHELEQVTVIGEDGMIVAPAPEAYVGLPVHEARERVVGDLRAQGRIRGEEDYTHAVPFSHRSGARVEPLISLQWFMRMEELAAPAIAAVREGRIRVTPERWGRVYLDWLENIRPWCISRQLWWGHRLPVYYRGDETHVGMDPPDGDGWERDPDVLDTWFSSGLWPFSTLGWPDRTDDLASFYPTSVLVTGYDIIFFWVARMLMFGCHFQPPTPFEVVAIHGMVRDAQGKKMSKSFGNVIDPIELMDRYGTDALRFALIRGANPGGDVPLAEEWVEGARNFANKLWNLGRFVIGSTGAPAGEPAPGGSLADRWLLSRLERTRAEVTAAYDAYDPAEAARLLHGFAWSELADWAVELAKPRLTAGGEDAERAGAALAHALEVTLRLLHPIMPFVTEELARALTGVETLPLGPWPAERPGDLDPQAEAAMADLQETIVALRRFRAEHRVPPSRRPRLVVVPAGDDQAALYEAEADSIRHLARLEAVEVVGRHGSGGPGGTLSAPLVGQAAKLLAAGSELYMPLEGLLDLGEERARLERELAALDAERARAEAKLANPAFLEKAPAPVVAKARERLAQVDQDLAKVRAQQTELSGAR